MYYFIEVQKHSDCLSFFNWVLFRWTLKPWRANICNVDWTVWSAPKILIFLHFLAGTFRCLESVNRNQRSTDESRCFHSSGKVLINVVFTTLLHPSPTASVHLRVPLKKRNLQRNVRHYLRKSITMLELKKISPTPPLSIFSSPFLPHPTPINIFFTPFSSLDMQGPHWKGWRGHHLWQGVVEAEGGTWIHIFYDI